jgi:murein DD-endopeptidase MepM/ murein hydrolase activator NlpD
MSWRASHYVAAGTLAAAGLVWAVRDAWPGRRPLTAPTIRVEHAYVEDALALGRTETLSDLLSRSGIVGRDRFAFLSAATDLPVRRLRPGIVFHFRRLQTDSVADRVTVRLSPERRVQLSRSETGWLQATEKIPWAVSRVRVVGVIGSSLYDALDKSVPDRLLPLMERRSLAWAMAEVYDWQVDFTRDVHPGDRFRVLFERLESPEGEFRFGRVLAAEVDVAKVPTFAFAFVADASEPAAYYDERGRSLKRAFLRAPLQFRRVSSGFGARYHPILHRWRTHEGIDFAAPYGAPVRATADGMVSRVGRGDPGYGNLIEIRHASGIRTRYGHLSAFARGLQVGERVQQGETIGFVGSTGLSTGPHLHYEFLVNGRPTNPRRKDMGAGTPIPHNLRASYDSARAHLSAELEPSPNPIHPPIVPTVAARDD